METPVLGVAKLHLFNETTNQMDAMNKFEFHLEQWI
jgi:hypothetical protein